MPRTPAAATDLEAEGFRIRPGRWGAAALAWALVAAAVGALGHWTCDDAYISYRYARHLAEGHGLVFNLGEAPPIEGFSNLLWVLVLALFELVGVASTRVAPVLSIACFAWLVGQVASDLCALTPAGKLRTSAVMVAGLLSLPPMVVWSTSGLETMAFTLALYQTGRALTALGTTRSLVLWSISAVALRVDGGAYLAALLATGCAASLVWPASVERRRLLVLFVSAALAVVVIMLFRKLYFGYWSPHTARVKVDPSWIVFDRGTRYVLAMLVGIPGLALLALIASGWGTLRLLLSRVPAEKGLIALFGAPFVVGLLLSILAGGDFMAFARFFVPAVPFLVVLFALAFAANGGALRTTLLVLSTAVMLAANALVLGDLWRLPAGLAERVHFRWNNPGYTSEAEVWRNMQDRAEEWAHLGRALAAHTSPGETYVRGAIGAVGYYTELFLLDTYGLVNTEVAAGEGHPAGHSPGHDKQVPDSFFLKDDPDYFTYTDLVPDTNRNQGIPPELVDQPFLKENFAVEFEPVAGLDGVVLRLVRYIGGAKSE